MPHWPPAPESGGSRDRRGREPRNRPRPGCSDRRKPGRQGIRRLEISRRRLLQGHGLEALERSGQAFASVTGLTCPAIAPHDLVLTSFAGWRFVRRSRPSAGCRPRCCSVSSIVRRAARPSGANAARIIEHAEGRLDQAVDVKQRLDQPV